MNMRFYLIMIKIFFTKSLIISSFFFLFAQLQIGHRHLDHDSMYHILSCIWKHGISDNDLETILKNTFPHLPILRFAGSNNFIFIYYKLNIIIFQKFEQ